MGEMSCVTITFLTGISSKTVKRSYGNENQNRGREISTRKETPQPWIEPQNRKLVVKRSLTRVPHTIWVLVTIDGDIKRCMFLQYEQSECNYRQGPPANHRVDNTI